MEWIEIIVHTTTAGADAVSQALIDEGAQGTMVEDRADVPDPAHPNGFWEIIDAKLIEAMPEDVLVHAWFEQSASFPDKFQALSEKLTILRSAGFDAGSLKIDRADVHDEDWSEVWKQFYKPFRLGKHMVVKPSWEHYDALEGDIIIEIDPGMAFGSGTHETTGMCIELLESTVHPDDRVVDVGTGSGILAIGAALLGAREVTAIDIDPNAVKVAKENIARSGFSDRITAIEGNLLDKLDITCEICVANIIADVICMFAEPLNDHIVPGGLFICSGIIKERESDVTRALSTAGYEILEIRRKGEWVAVLSRRHA